MPHTLLLADDSVTIQRVIELTFADEDIKVVAVGDGDEAIARLEAAPPDIVLADIGMPGKNGYEVAEYVKKSPRLAHIPVVLLTGAFGPVDQAKAEAVGCDGVLEKPFEPQLVIARVRELLARPGPPPLAPDANVAPSPAPPTQSWASSLVNPGLAARNVPAAGATKVDDYFERLDAAFAGLATGSPAPPEGGASTSSVPDELDWFRSQLNAPPATTAESRELSMPPPGPSAPPDLPLSHRSLRADFDRGVAPHTPLEHFPAPERLPAMSGPPLADVFAALLAAEQKAPAPSAAPAWPAARVEGPGVTDDLVEQVTRRVLDRLSDRVVREKVAEVVSAIAERLVREEIERIKASIK